MGLSSTEANAQLAGINTIEELRELISRIDVTATGNVTVFYSGDADNGQKFGDISRHLEAAQGDMRILDNTEVARFLNIQTNPDLLFAMDRIVGGDPSIEGTP